jgi:hypothetical protein
MRKRGQMSMKNDDGRRQMAAAPFGYDRVSTLVPGPGTEVAAVKEVFHNFAERQWGLRKIARNLNGKRVPSPSGGAWSVGQVQMIISNPVYGGKAVRNSRASRTPITTKSDVLPLVSKKLFDQANKRTR